MPCDFAYARGKLKGFNGIIALTGPGHTATPATHSRMWGSSRKARLGVPAAIVRNDVLNVHSPAMVSSKRYVPNPRTSRSEVNDSAGQSGARFVPPWCRNLLS